ncbi:MAG: excinuclease ABC subunit C, partial [Candidatus Colwellbacteria bacterium CG10_big_fil_rev_8_21_14_0_10_41_28]
MDKKQLLKSIPNKPGVYLMKGGRGKIIYVGKAGSLKKRVSSYFLKAHDGKIEKLISEIKKIDYIETATAIEALILESQLIKKYNPPY